MCCMRYVHGMRARTVGCMAAFSLSSSTLAVILLPNREEPILTKGDGTTNRQDNKVEVLGRYKFYLAFENNDQ